jgi:hypothetical protein
MTGDSGCVVDRKKKYMPKITNKTRKPFENLSSEINIPADGFKGKEVSSSSSRGRVFLFHDQVLIQNRLTPSTDAVKSFPNQNQLSSMNGLPPSAAVDKLNLIGESANTIKNSGPQNLEEAICALRFLKAIQMYHSRMWIFINSQR